VLACAKISTTSSFAVSGFGHLRIGSYGKCRRLSYLYTYVLMKLANN
jgi:hypothetical protein